MYVGPWQEYALTRLWAAAVRAQKKKEADEKQAELDRRREKEGEAATVQRRQTHGTTNSGQSRPPRPPSEEGTQRSVKKSDAVKQRLPPLRAVERAVSSSGRAASTMRSLSRMSDDGAPSSAVSATSEPVTKDEKELDEEYMNELAEEWASCEGQPPWRALLPPPVTSVFERRRVDNNTGPRRKRRGKKKSSTQQNDPKVDRLQKLKKMKELYAKGKREEESTSGHQRSAPQNDTLPALGAQWTSGDSSRDAQASSHHNAIRPGNTSLATPVLDRDNDRNARLPAIAVDIALSPSRSSEVNRDFVDSIRPTSSGHNTYRDGSTTFLRSQVTTPRSPIKTPKSAKKGPEDEGFEDAVDGLLKWAIQLPDVDTQYDF